MRDDSPASFSSRLRWGIRAHVAVSSVALLAILLMVNYLAARRPIRWEAESRAVRELNPLTLRVLQGLTNDVSVVALFSHQNALSQPVIRLLRQYALHSSKIRLEVVNHLRDPGRARAIEKLYQQDGSDKGDRVIFAANGKTKVVGERALSEYKDATQEILDGRDVTRTGFRGEVEFTSAVYSVTDPHPVKAYFLAGHGENDPTDVESQAGYGRFVRILIESNVEAASLQLGTETVPKDCQLLIIAGPLNRIPPGELEEIDTYLKRGGRLLVLLRNESLDRATGSERSGLYQLLTNWGITTGSNQILDHLNGRSSSREEVLVMDYGSHPVVDPFRHRTRIRLALPRSIEPRFASGAGVDAPRITELLRTSPEAIAIPAGGLHSNRVASASRAYALAVAAEKGSLQGISDRGIPRLVVIGDSHCFGNLLIQDEANRDFARNTINWLLSKDVQLAGIGPRPMDEYRISLTTREMNTIRWVLLAGLPGAALVLGWFVWLRRRS